MRIYQIGTRIQAQNVCARIRIAEVEFEKALLNCTTEDEMDELTRLYREEIAEFKKSYKHIAKKYRKI